jgi:hypothetical protein
MKYRRLDENGDYVFGKGDLNFYTDVPEAPAQAVLTRLKLIQGEWFIDTSAGTPYQSQILGMGRLATYNFAIQQRIVNTLGVTELVDYASSFNAATRKVMVVASIETAYGTATVTTTL